MDMFLTRQEYESKKYGIFRAYKDQGIRFLDEVEGAGTKKVIVSKIVAFKPSQVSTKR